jgi:cyclohexanecarboxylate-CoA ligase
VVGLADPVLGERCCAVVACRDAADPLRFDEMVAHLEGCGLMRQKFPEQLELVDALPRNPSGKVVKTALRERFGAEAR